MRSILKRAAMALVAAVALAGCESAPITGRTRFAPMDDSRLRGEAAAFFAQETSQNPQVGDTRTVDMVTRVGRRIAHAAENPPNNLWQPPNFQWEFKVIDKPEAINAVCLPGGKIIVYSGMLPVAMDDDGLAVIMGHEVAHALMRHHGERLSNNAAVKVGTTVVSVLVGALLGVYIPQPATSLINNGVSTGGSLLQLSFSRTQESEADRVGMILSAHAGYDPRAAIAFWQRVHDANGNGTRAPQFLSTHPSVATRIADIEKHMPEALKYYRAGNAQ